MLHSEAMHSFPPFFCLNLQVVNANMHLVDFGSFRDFYIKHSSLLLETVKQKVHSSGFKNKELYPNPYIHGSKRYKTEN